MQVNNGLPNNGVLTLAVIGTNLFAGTGGGGVFLSTNRGASWSNAGFTDTYVYALAVSDNNLFAATDSGVFLSTNNGTSWTQTGLMSSGATALIIVGTNLFAGTDDGVWRRPLSEMIQVPN